MSEQWLLVKCKGCGAWVPVFRSILGLEGQCRCGRITLVRKKSQPKKKLNVRTKWLDEDKAEVAMGLLGQSVKYVITREVEA
jgi:hypothetical protein